MLRAAYALRPLGPLMSSATANGDQCGALVADYKKQGGNKIDLRIIPFIALRQKEIAAVISDDVPEVMGDADFSFTPLTDRQDKLVMSATSSRRRKPSSATTRRRNYNGVTKQRSYYGVPMKMATTTFHVWQSLIEKAGYKVSNIPKTWDAYIDFFLPMQSKLRSQSNGNTYAMSLEWPSLFRAISPLPRDRSGRSVVRNAALGRASDGWHPEILRRGASAIAAQFGLSCTQASTTT